jgi:hypothetical protein
VVEASYLQQRREELRAGSQETRTRNELLAALDENDCNAPMQQYDGRQDDARSYEGQPYGEPHYAEPPSIDDQANRDDTFIPLDGDESPGLRRTRARKAANAPQHDLRAHLRRRLLPDPLECYLLRFRPRRQHLPADVPGDRDGALLSRRLPGRDGEHGSASTGAPYSAMPNAFAYKNRKPGEKSSCSCNLPAYYEQMRRNQQVSAVPPKGSITTIETAKPTRRPQHRHLNRPRRLRSPIGPMIPPPARSARSARSSSPASRAHRPEEPRHAGRPAAAAGTKQ